MDIYISIYIWIYIYVHIYNMYIYIHIYIHIYIILISIYIYIYMSWLSIIPLCVDYLPSYKTSIFEGVWDPIASCLRCSPMWPPRWKTCGKHLENIWTTYGKHREHQQDQDLKVLLAYGDCTEICWVGVSHSLGTPRSLVSRSRIRKFGWLWFLKSTYPLVI